MDFRENDSKLFGRYSSRKKNFWRRKKIKTLYNPTKPTISHSITDTYTKIQSY